MKLGNKAIIILFINLFCNNLSFSEEKIVTSPLINLEKIKPSFEESNEENENYTSKQNLKEKKILKT